MSSNIAVLTLSIVAAIVAFGGCIMTMLQNALSGKCLYHFTDVRNLQSIMLSGGLFSLRELSRRELFPVAPGGNQWSRDAAIQRGLDDYVSLCFFSQHPMEFLARKENRIGQSVFLQVSLDVLSFEGVKFCDEVSNKSGATLIGPEQAMVTLDLEVITKRLDWKIPEIQARLMAAKKYEVLIPKHVPLKFLSGL